MKKINVAVSVVVNSNNKILMTQRYSPESPDVHLKWQLPGGGVEVNETIESACTRETLEETGLKIKLLSKKPIIVSHIYGDTNYILHAFKASVVSGTINTDLDPETNDAKWYTLNDIGELEMLKGTMYLVESCLK